MARKVILSSLGIDIQEAEIIEFKKKLGDKVKRGDIIANVESQKVSFEVVSPIDGVILEIFYKERDTIKVGDTIAIVGEENENISEYIANNSYTEKKVVNKKVKLERDKRIKVFPSARKLAEKYDIDLCKVKSSVESEIISKKDVEEYLNKKLKYEEINDVEGYEVVEFTGSRKIIADRMLSSIQNAAHVTTIIEIDMTDVRIIKEKYRKTHGKVSYMAFIIKAIIDGIKEVPIINSIIKENKILSIKAGYVDGKVLSDKEVESLASLPSKEELVAKMLGSLNAPLSGLVNVLNGNIRGLAVALNAIKEQKECA